jgi:hypothetical protein
MRSGPNALARLAALGLLLLGPVGCDDDLRIALPAMSLDADSLDFGLVAVGDSLALRVAVDNQGFGPLFLSAELEQELPVVFGLTLAPSRVEARARVELEVTFIPLQARAYAGRLVVRGNDPARPEASVALRGQGYRRGQLEVFPDVLDFGLVNAGQAGLGQVSVRNAGNGDLTVTLIALTADTQAEFSILSSTRTPAVLQAGAEVTLNLAYRPGAESPPPGPGRLRVRATDPERPEASVTLLARLNRAPVADAGPDRQTDPFVEVVLDGSASYDPDGDEPLTYAWRLMRAPEGSTAGLLSADGPQARLTPDLVGVYEAELRVRDATGLESLLPDRAAVTALPKERLLVELVWDSPIGDLDLHVLAPGGIYGGLLDCHWANPNPDWGVPGDPTDDPSLLRDDLAGFGPETFGYGAPLPGDYRVVVDYFSSHTPSGQEPTTATLRVYLDGLLAAEFARRLGQQGERWEALSIRWPEGGVTPLAGGRR